MAKETITGKIASTQYLSTSENQWKRYSITFDDGKAQNVVFQPGVEYEPKVGDQIGIYKGMYNNWVLDRESVGIDWRNDGGGGNGGGSQTPAGGTSANHANTSDAYWKNKTAYEQGIRDPKIEWQSYFENVREFYVAAIPNLTKPPKTTQQIDAYIDDAIAKADAIFIRKNKKREEDAS